MFNKPYQKYVFNITFFNRFDWRSLTTATIRQLLCDAFINLDLSYSYPIVFCLFLNIKRIIGLESPQVRTFTTVRTSEYLMLRFLNILSAIITSITNEAMAQANRAIKPMIPISSSKQKTERQRLRLKGSAHLQLCLKPYSLQFYRGDIYYKTECKYTLRYFYQIRFLITNRKYIIVGRHIISNTINNILFLFFN